MVLTITIQMDGAAFDPPAWETARILQHLARRIEAGEVPATLDDRVKLRDINGNPVGAAVWCS